MRVRVVNLSFSGVFVFPFEENPHPTHPKNLAGTVRNQFSFRFATFPVSLVTVVIRKASRWRQSEVT